MNTEILIFQKDYKKSRQLVKALNFKSTLDGGGGFYVTCRTESKHIVLILKALKAKAKMIHSITVKDSARLLFF